MKPVNYWLANPQLLRREIAKLNEYVDKFNEEMLAWRRGKTLKIIEEILNERTR